MKLLQGFQIFSMTFASSVFTFSGYWYIAIFPEIITKNFKITDPEEKSSFAGLFVAVNLVGQILGSLWWSRSVKYISKINSISLALLMQAISICMIGNSSSLCYVLFWRFFLGLFFVNDSIGKDYIYEFAHAYNRQLVFVLRTIAFFTASLFGPFVGYAFYEKSNKDLGKTVLYLAIPNLISIFFILVAFYCFEKPPVIELSDEEALELVDEKHEEHHPKEVSTNEQVGIIETLKFCYRKQSLWNMVVGFSLMFAAYDAQITIGVFYMETPWIQQGLGFSAEEVSLIMISLFIPNLLFFFYSNKVIPRKLSIKSYTKLILKFSAVFCLILPVLRDLFGRILVAQKVYFLYAFVGVFMLVNPHQTSPFVNYHMNNQVKKNARISFNSITFIGYSLVSLVFFLTLVPFYSVSMYTPMFIQFSPFNKYICFGVLSIFLMIAAFKFRKLRLSK